MGMVVATNDRIFLSPAEYLKWEPWQEFRHEYVDGEAFGMTGGTLPGYQRKAGQLNDHLRAS